MGLKVLMTVFFFASSANAADMFYPPQDSPKKNADQTEVMGGLGLRKCPPGMIMQCSETVITDARGTRSFQQCWCI